MCLKQITVHDEELRLRKVSLDGFRRRKMIYICMLDCWMLDAGCGMCYIAFHLITSHKFILYCQATSNRNHHCQFIWLTKSESKLLDKLIFYENTEQTYTIYMGSGGYVIWIISELQMHSTNLNIFASNTKPILRMWMKAISIFFIP